MSKPTTYKSQAIDGLEYKYHQYPSDQEGLVEIFLNGKKVFEWDDTAQQNCPEDLCWLRLLKDIFEAGILAERVSK